MLLIALQGVVDSSYAQLLDVASEEVKIKFKV